MANNLYQQLNTMANNSSNLSLSDFQKNPQAIIQQMTRSNPNVANMMQEYTQSGMNAKDFFFRKVGELGVNPQSILNQLK